MEAATTKTVGKAKKEYEVQKKTDRVLQLFAAVDAKIDPLGIQGVFGEMVDNTEVSLRTLEFLFDLYEEKAPGSERDRDQIRSLIMDQFTDIENMIDYCSGPRDKADTEWDRVLQEMAQSRRGDPETRRSVSHP